METLPLPAGVLCEITGFVTSIEDAIRAGNIRALRRLLASNKSMRRFDDEKTQWFDLALMYNHLAIVKELYRRGARGSPSIMATIACYGFRRLRKWARAHLAAQGITKNDCSDVAYRIFHEIDYDEDGNIIWIEDGIIDLHEMKHGDRELHAWLESS